MVDLDSATRRPDEQARPGAQFHVTIRPTTQINMSALRGYLEQKIEFSTPVQEAMNFMDHLIRQGPSQRSLAIKRNFYSSQDRGRPLDGDDSMSVIEAHKGLYASLRMVRNRVNGGLGLSLNADVANTAFWIGGLPISEVICNFLGTCDRRFARKRPNEIQNLLFPEKRPDGSFDMSEAFKHLRKMRRLRFRIKHTNRGAVDKVYSIQDFVFDAKFQHEGGHANNVKFDYEGKQTSVNDYYMKKYRVSLKYPLLPLIKDSKGSCIPPELAFIEPMQRYMMKLNPVQTQNMIKTAVTVPKIRRGDIENKVSKILQLGTDPWLKTYGVQFEQAFTQTPAKLLKEPDLKFSRGNVKMTSHPSWRIDGQKFIQPNKAPLKSWGIMDLTGRAQQPALANFARQFRNTFIGHGCVSPGEAVVLDVPGNVKNNPANAMKWAVDQLTAKAGYPQLLFVVGNGKNDEKYERIKRNADCRFGILSQVVALNHVVSCKGQYLSNVCMKVNAKLGGATCITPAPWSSQGTYFPKERTTMIIGVDVSHAAPGQNTGSVAAMTMSMDPDGLRYAAAVENNGHRVEVLQEHVVNGLFSTLSPAWKQGHAEKGITGPPGHIIYFRDGVAEGQFAQVMAKEIAPLRKKFAALPKQPKFTVIVATKRHHIRFFPTGNAADVNQNSKRGLLVEKEVTHPFMWDFFLNSHFAIKGTARPVHYHVIYDDSRIPCAALQDMIFRQCFSYARATTAVSLHPAVYYAHLASSRGRYHNQSPASEGFKHGGKGHEIARDHVAKGMSASQSDVDVSDMKMIPVGGNHNGTSIEGRAMTPDEVRIRQFILGTMWYI